MRIQPKFLVSYHLPFLHHSTYKVWNSLLTLTFFCDDLGPLYSSLIQFSIEHEGSVTFHQLDYNAFIPDTESSIQCPIDTEQINIINHHGLSLQSVVLCINISSPVCLTHLSTCSVSDISHIYNDNSLNRYRFLRRIIHHPISVQNQVMIDDSTRWTPPSSFLETSAH